MFVVARHPSFEHFFDCSASAFVRFANTVHGEGFLTVEVLATGSAFAVVAVKRQFWV